VELGRFSNQLSTGRECVPSRKLVIARLVLGAVRRKLGAEGVAR